MQIISMVLIFSPEADFRLGRNDLEERRLEARDADGRLLSIPSIC